MTRLRWRILVIAIPAIGILYWAIGASYGAGLVRGQMHEHLADTSDQTLALDHLRFNPFTMTARFEGLRLSDVTADPVLTIAAGHLRLAFTSLFGGTFKVSNLFLQQPNLYVAVSGPTGDRRLHSLGSLRSPAGDRGNRRPIRITDATIDGGHVTIFEAAGAGTVPTSLGIHISEVKLELTDWESDAATPASFGLTARVNDTGTLDVQGDWVPVSHSVDATVELNGLVLSPIAPLLDSWLTDYRLAGVLDAHGQFRHHADATGFEGQLEIEQLSVDGITGQSVLSADTLTARGVKIGSEQWPATAQWVDVERPGVVLDFNENGELNVRRLIARTAPRIDKVTVRDGFANFTDARLASIVQIDVNNVTGEMIRHVDGSLETLTINLTGDAPKPWAATIGGVINRDDNQVRAVGDATFDGIDVSSVSTYFSSMTAREITGGLLSLNLHYRVEGPEMVIASKGVLSDLELSKPAGEVPASHLPLDLAIALLTDENHRMAFELTVNIPAIDSGDARLQALDNALTGFVNTTTAESLNIVAMLANLSTDEVSRVVFTSGSPEILPAANHQLTALVSALARRPLLGMRLQGHYAAQADRAALARRQVGLHVALAASTHTNNSSAAAELDFTDPKVQAVLDEFAAARLDVGERKRLKSGGPEKGDEAPPVVQELYYPAVFEALAAKESVSDYALRQLARYRAHSLVGRLQELGIEPQRLEVDKQATAAADGMPATVALTILAHKRPDD